MSARTEEAVLASGIGPAVRPALTREMAKMAHIWGKDMRIEWRNLDNVPAMFFFSLLILVIFNFGFDFATAEFLSIGPGVLWVAFTFSGVLSFSNSFALERDGDCLQGLMLAPVDPGSVYLGKLLANLTSMLLVETALVPLSAVFFGYDLWPVLGPLAAVLLIHTLGFAAVGTLFGALTARTRRGDVLLPILMFSMSVPLMISAVSTTAAVLAKEALLSGRASAWLTMAGVFDLVFVTAAFLTFEFLIEE
ncbi:MAG TPA: heme exporter protein CcmB [Candidatus Polarisedimenticolia bacterium]|nr:heme exporter protein CcmB [Candidatus Polarisedimenticolia bacterium]